METGLVGTATVALVTVGLPLGAAFLLNWRDRRRRRLLDAVLPLLASPDLRGRVAVEARSRLFRPGGIVQVHVLLASRAEIWDLIARLSARLAARVRVEVTPPVDRAAHAVFTLSPASSGGAR
jgi:hypothetical protein